MSWAPKLSEPVARVPGVRFRWVTGRRDIDRLRNELEDLFNEVWRAPRFSARRCFRPPVDCFERGSSPVRGGGRASGVDPSPSMSSLRTLAPDHGEAAQAAHGQGWTGVPADGDRVRPLRAAHSARRRRRDPERGGVPTSRACSRWCFRSLRARRHAASADRGEETVTEAIFDIDEDRPDEIEIPSTLAVLPLKETIVFPGSLTPLAIGQERSVRLIDDVVSDEPRILALVAARTEDVEEPGWEEPVRDRDGGDRRQDDQGP